MSRVFSLLTVVGMMLFFSLPMVGVLLWVVVFVLGYTPSFWVALFVLVGVLLNVGVLVGRSIHPTYRSR